MILGPSIFFRHLGKWQVLSNVDPSARHQSAHKQDADIGSIIESKLSHRLLTLECGGITGLLLFLRCRRMIWTLSWPHEVPTIGLFYLGITCLGKSQTLFRVLPPAPLDCDRRGEIKVVSMESQYSQQP